MSKAPRKSIIANFGAFNAPREELSTPDGDEPIGAQPVGRVGAGIIGATRRTLTDIREERDRLKAELEAASSLTDLDPQLIDPSPFPDRLRDDNDADFVAFKELFASEGQKVPIQVRVHPDNPERFQLAYGHRRLRAARELGQRVKAIVVSLTDPQLAIAQGIENAARQDLSWIEKALFVWRMDQAGLLARDICAALSIDRAELAKLRSVSRAIPIDVIEMIGRAPKVGRPRWIELATNISSKPASIGDVRKLLADQAVATLRSDERFGRVVESLKTPTASTRFEAVLESADGLKVGKVTIAGREVKLTIEKGRADAFGSFLRAELPLLIEKFIAQESDHKS